MIMIMITIMIMMISSVKGIVDAVTPTVVYLQISTTITGQLWTIDHPDTPLQFDPTLLPVGSTLDLTVCNLQRNGTALGVSCRPDCLTPLSPGDTVPAIIAPRPATHPRVTEAATVELPGHRQALLYCTDVLEPRAWVNNPLKSLANERVMKEVTVAGMDAFYKTEEMFCVTLRSDAQAIQPPVWERGQMAYGFVVAASKRGIFVR